MRKYPKALLFFCVLVLLLSVTSCGRSPAPNPVPPASEKSASEPVHQVVVDTNDNFVGSVMGEKITQSEFYFFLTQTKMQMESAANLSDPTAIAQFWNTKSNGKDPKETAKESTLNYLKEFKIHLIQVKSDKFTLSEEDKAQLKKTFDNIITQNGGEKAVAEMLKNQYSISLSSYRDIFENTNLVDKYLSQKQKAINVSEDEASTYYDENKKKIDTVTVVHVLFSTIDEKTKQPLSADQVAKAEKDANDCLKKVDEGADIKELATKLSQDPGVTQNKGEYTFKRGEMVKEFEEWAFSHDVGDIGIVKSSYGYHVMKKTGKSTKQQGVDSAKEEIQKNKLKAMITAWNADPKYDITKNEAVFKNLRI